MPNAQVMSTDALNVSLVTQLTPKPKNALPRHDAPTVKTSDRTVVLISAIQVSISSKECAFMVDVSKDTLPTETEVASDQQPNQLQAKPWPAAETNSFRMDNVWAPVLLNTTLTQSQENVSPALLTV